jgi:hypothetical protein
MRQGSAGRTKQRGLERHHPVAIRCGALGEQYDRLAGKQTFGHFGGLRSGIARPGAIDKDRALQPRQPPEHRPLPNFGFGDEDHIGDGAQNQNVFPRDMIGDDQQRPPAVIRP